MSEPTRTPKKGRGADKKPRKGSPRTGEKKATPRHKSPQIREQEQLRAKEQRAVELLVLGRPVATIADELGLDRGTIYKWMTKPEVAEQIRQGNALQRQAATLELERRAGEIAGRLAQVALGEEKASREELNAMQDVLDRLGFQPPKKIEVQGGLDLTHLPDHELKSIAASVHDR